MIVTQHSAQLEAHRQKYDIVNALGLTHFAHLHIGTHQLPSFRRTQEVEIVQGAAR